MESYQVIGFNQGGEGILKVGERLNRIVDISLRDNWDIEQNDIMVNNKKKSSVYKRLKRQFLIRLYFKTYFFYGYISDTLIFQ